MKAMPTLLVLMALLIPLTAAAAPLQVVLHPEVTVDSEDVYLGQIASLTGADASLRQAMATAVITAAPAPGETRLIDADYVRVRLGQHRIADGWRLEGAGPVRVTRGHQVVSAAQLGQMAADHVLAHLPYPREDVVIEDVAVAGDVTLPRGQLGVDIRLAGGADYIGSVPLVVDLSLDGRPVRRCLVTVRTEVLAPVVIARRPLARYQIIGAEDLTVSRVDLARVPENRVLDPDEVVGQRAGRMIPAQTVLTAQMVETPPLVRRGDRVTIVAEGGGLRVTALGEVRQAAARGDTVAVVNLDSRRKIMARVVDGQTVTVNF